MESLIVLRDPSRAPGSTRRAGLAAPLLIPLLAAMLACVSGCGSSAAPPPEIVPASPPQSPPPLEEYRLQVGDEVSVRVVNQPEFSGLFRVRPDGYLTAPGVGDLPAAGMTVPELAEQVRAGLRRLIRYPDVSVMLTNYASQLVFIFGEVELPGSRQHLPNMTSLQALAAAGGPTEVAKLSSVLVLRRTGPADVDVYEVDLEAPVDGDPTAADVYLQPYDVVYVPRNLIGEVNVFVDHWIRQNIAPFSAYIEGWRAFNIDELRTVVR
ncbi:MAG: hypothetical protein GF330_08520 [Candidatus Eisenbacteria bacterium]|nr:hypothetical protein [Candidatus Eisenbacteria bacterium]